MGGEEYSKKQQSQSRNRTIIRVIFLLISTNLLTFFLTNSNFSFRLSDHDLGFFLQNSNTQTLKDELNSTRSQIDVLHGQLTTASTLVHKLLGELQQVHEKENNDESTVKQSYSDLSDETRLIVSPHKLPLGFNTRMDSDELYEPMGLRCKDLLTELNQYMTYEIGGECPSDDIFAQKLMLKGCEPLPRRRCHPKSPIGYVEPHPFPKSLWSTPPDTSIIWDPYNCKNYQCLINRKNSKGIYDCKDCFELEGREKQRWLSDNNHLDYSIDKVLSTKPPGTIRIGLDIGGGSGTFAARMRERNITIVTTSMNFDGPFNSFIASRGLISMHISVSHRLPFFENTLDIVHSMHVLSNWIPDKMLEFTLYDIYRVLRPGGLFWLDHFFCVGKQLNETYVPLFDSIGFNKLRWNVGRKMDRSLDEWYISALLEKPMT